MILIDFSQTIIANVCATAPRMGEDLNVDYIRHVALMQIRATLKKHPSYKKNVVIACDCHGSMYWRKRAFPYYKARRKTDREASPLPWTLLFEAIDTIKKELKENFPYRVIEVPEAEADDIIGTLVETYYNEELEGILIVSSDGDFKQLQKYHGVKQWNPIKGAFVRCDNPKAYLKEHILRGDSGDGIPNFLSSDDTFVDSSKRQKVISQKKLDAWLTMDSLKDICVNEQQERNYFRNEQLIDLEYTPLRIKTMITDAYEEEADKDRSKIFNYFVKNKLKNLMDSVGDF